MRKIGILTFHDALNYGAVLQAYALCEVLQKKIDKNIEFEIIDYKNSQIEKQYSYRELFRKTNLFKFAFHARRLNKRKQVFRSFKKEYLPLSMKVYRDNTLHESSRIYSKYIVGSDQVWNPKYAGNNMLYLLPFLSENIKRNSYAACFGEAISKDLLEINMVDELKKFQSVSVRERSVLNELNKEGIEAQVHIDPTMLLNQEEWGKFIDCRKKENYILIYSIQKPIKLIQKAKAYAEKKNLKIIYITNGLKKIKGITTVNNPSVPDFLNYIANAECIFTNSFHGTVFSILFHKIFYEEVQYQGGKNERVVELLKLLNLEKHIIDNIDEVTLVETDWNNVDRILNNEREVAFLYLKKICTMNDEVKSKV